MLVLSRKKDEKLHLILPNELGTIIIQVVDITKGKVKIGIDADESIDIVRPPKE